MATSDASRIIKVNDNLVVDEEHGLVVGWGIVSTVNGQDYYDLNVDQAGVHKGKKVPENITHGAVIKALIGAAEVGVLPGNEMHDGPDTGVFVGLFYMDDDIAKSMGMTTEKTGLMVQYHPTPDVLEKFKTGEFTGFSMEGLRLDYEEFDDGN